MMRTILFFTFLFLSCVRVEAADNYITVPFASYHFDRGRGYNERNFGFGAEAAIVENVRLKAVFFENSRFRESTFLGVAATPFHFDIGPVDLDVGALGGKVTGYSIEPLWIVLPLGRFTYKQHGLNVTATPKAHGQKGGVGFEYLWTWEKP